MRTLFSVMPYDIINTYQFITQAAMYSSISGPSEHILGQTGVVFGAMKLSYREAMVQIFGDLTRIRFIPTNGKTYSDFVQAWMQADVVSDYLQGMMDGKIETLAFSKFSAQEPPQLSGNIGIAYFNDNGEACGVGITWLRDSPTTLSGAVIRDTPSSKRVMTQLLPTFLLTNQESANTLDDMEENFLPLLESKEMVEQLSGFKNNTGVVDVAKLQQLEDSAVVHDKSTCKAKQQRFTLIEQYFDEKLKNKQIPEIERYNSDYLMLSTKLNAIKTDIGPGISAEAKQLFYTRNRNALGLLTVGILVPLGLFTFGAPLIALALSIVVSSLFIIAPSAIFMRTKEAAISTYKSAQAALEATETPDQHSDKLFERLCRPLLLQEADGMTDKQVKQYMDNAIAGQAPIIPTPSPMGPLMTTIPGSACEPAPVTAITPPEETPTYTDSEKETIGVPFKLK